MAYYTIAHLVETINAEDLTEDVFDYVFCLSETLPSKEKVPKDLLAKMRKEFQFWYLGRFVFVMFIIGLRVAGILCYCFFAACGLLDLFQPTQIRRDSRNDGVSLELQNRL